VCVCVYVVHACVRVCVFALQDLCCKRCTGGTHHTHSHPCPVVAADRKKLVCEITVSLLISTCMGSSRS
jgi:hypothetical protein